MVTNMRLKIDVRAGTKYVCIDDLIIHLDNELDNLNAAVKKITDRDSRIYFDALVEYITDLKKEMKRIKSE